MMIGKIRCNYFWWDVIRCSDDITGCFCKALFAMFFFEGINGVQCGCGKLLHVLGAPDSVRTRRVVVRLQIKH